MTDAELFGALYELMKSARMLLNVIVIYVLYLLLTHFIEFVRDFRKGSK